MSRVDEDRWVNITKLSKSLINHQFWCRILLHFMLKKTFENLYQWIYLMYKVYKVYTLYIYLTEKVKIFSHTPTSFEGGSCKPLCELYVPLCHTMKDSFHQEFYNILHIFTVQTTEEGSVYAGGWKRREETWERKGYEWVLPSAEAGRSVNPRTPGTDSTDHPDSSIIFTLNHF